ncbi:MAG: hypothetical protein ACJAS4_003974 [Bacteriovoracaceae bacterium]|jgi:hypothetical protein
MTAEKPIRNINKPKVAGDRLWKSEISGMRDAHVPNTTPLTVKITETANLLFLITLIYLL